MHKHSDPHTKARIKPEYDFQLSLHYTVVSLCTSDQNVTFAALKTLKKK